MSLEKLAQSDELYIKMNARGKALSHFENFKADLIDWMANPENPNTSKFISVVNGGKYTGHLYYQMISSKIDGVWSAYFWNTTKSDSWKGDKMIDNLFLRFFCRYELDQYIIKHNLRTTSQILNTNCLQVWQMRANHTLVLMYLPSY